MPPSTAPLAPVAAALPLGQLGPAMSRLSAVKRRFIAALLDSGNTNYTAAVRSAGLFDAGESYAAIRQRACRLAHDPEIAAAIQEESRNRIQASALMAASELVKIAGDGTRKDQLKAIEMVLGRAGLHAITESRQTVQVTITDEEKVARIALLAGQLGIDPSTLLGRAAPPALPSPLALVNGDVIEGHSVAVTSTGPDDYIVPDELRDVL